MLPKFSFSSNVIWRYWPIEWLGGREASSGSCAATDLLPPIETEKKNNSNNDSKNSRNGTHWHGNKSKCIEWYPRIEYLNSTNAYHDGLLPDFGTAGVIGKAVEVVEVVFDTEEWNTTDRWDAILLIVDLGTLWRRRFWNNGRCWHQIGPFVVVVIVRFRLRFSQTLHNERPGSSGTIKMATHWWQRRRRLLQRHRARLGASAPTTHWTGTVTWLHSSLTVEPSPRCGISPGNHGLEPSDVGYCAHPDWLLSSSVGALLGCSVSSCTVTTFLYFGWNREQGVL